MKAIKPDTMYKKILPLLIFFVAFFLKLLHRRLTTNVPGQSKLLPWVLELPVPLP